MYYQGFTANQLYRLALDWLRDAPIQEGRDEPTKELTHVMFELTESRNRLVSMRDINPAFAWVEVLWIMAGGNSVRYLEFWNKRMWDYADKETGLLYGAYGHRLGNHWIWLGKDMSPEFDVNVSDALYTDPVDYESNSQMSQAYTALDSNPNSRQVVLHVWDKLLDLPVTDGCERAADIPCNIMSHLLVRDGKLHWLQVMRSNDAIWGWPYNIIQWTFLQEIMAGWLGIEPGPFVLVSDSFHAYQRHWDRLEPIIRRYYEQSGKFPEFHTNSYALPFDDWSRSFRAMIETAYALTVCPLGEEKDLVMSIFNVCDIRYLGLMGMLAAEATRIKLKREGFGMMDKAYSIANDLMGSELYWKAAWLRWADGKSSGNIL